MSAAPERPAIVTLARRGEGLAWLQLGLWALLATSIVSSLATAMLIHDLVTSGVNRRAWVTEVHEVASLVSVMVQLFAGAGLLIGVVLWRREESDRATRGLLGLAAVVIGVGIAHDLASLYLTLAVRAEEVAHADALRLMEFQRWSWIAAAVEWPAVFVALMTALGRMARARGQRVATALLVTVALASLAPLGLMLLGVVGIEVPLSSPTSRVLMHLGISIVAVGGALLVVRRASRIDGRAGQEALPGGPGWERAASGLDILVGALIARILLGLAAPLGMLLGLAESTPGGVTTATFLVTAIRRARGSRGHGRGREPPAGRARAERRAGRQRSGRPPLPGRLPGPGSCDSRADQLAGFRSGRAWPSSWPWPSRSSRSPAPSRCSPP